MKERSLQTEKGDLADKRKIEKDNLSSDEEQEELL